MKKDFNLSTVFAILSCLIFSGACTQGTSYVPSSPAIPNSSYNYNQNNYPRSYQPQYQPNSRSYSNPYSYPTRNYYPYYDFDQYYVPPTQYQGNENYSDPGYSNTGSIGKF